MHTRFAALIAAGVLALSVAVGVPAWAQQKPLEGTPACTALVDRDLDVLRAVEVLTLVTNIRDGLPEGTPQADLDRAEGNVETATTSLATRRAEATAELCTPATGSDPDNPGTDDPDDPSTDDPGDTSEITFESVRTLIAALNCDGYQQQLGRINDQVLTLISEGRLTSEQQGILTDELGARRDALDECFVAPTLPGAGGDTVDPTGDDGSTAATSGGQVTDVPAGSAQTGGA